MSLAKEGKLPGITSTSPGLPGKAQKKQQRHAPPSQAPRCLSSLLFRMACTGKSYNTQQHRTIAGTKAP
eukprot:4683969-Alexandrium_andersonii.AAC.1